MCCHDKTIILAEHLRHNLLFLEPIPLLLRELGLRVELGLHLGLDALL